jgi:hypothetical protein
MNIQNLRLEIFFSEDAVLFANERKSKPALFSASMNCKPCMFFICNYISKKYLIDKESSSRSEANGFQFSWLGKN